MKHSKLAKGFSLLLVVVMCIGAFLCFAFANEKNTDDGATSGTNGYYDVNSPKDYARKLDGTVQILNGPVADQYNDKYLNFYQNGVRVYDEGLYEYEGNYYYVRSNGLLLTWGMYIAEDKTNGLVSAGEYSFGADGKMQLLNGPVTDRYNEEYLNFYQNGARVYAEGLYMYEGNCYYVRSNGLLQTWGKDITAEKANGLVPAGYYEFGADGKMVIPEGITPGGNTNTDPVTPPDDEIWGPLE